MPHSRLLVFEIIASLFAAISLPAATGTLQIVPTTTLAAETGNNTSTASTFASQSNGNIGPTNISKVPYRSLLYPGANTLLWAHFMGWFGPSNHIQVGYASSDPTQVHNQVTDAISRGLSAFMEDWYGPNNSMPNSTLLALKTDAESRGGQFSFGLMYDGGALSTCHSTAGCDLTQQTISDLTYAYNTFENSPAYLRINNRPVVMFFSPDRYGTLNWSLIASSVPGNPLFIFQNSGGYTHAASSGSFAWVQVNTSNANDWEQSYLDSFFSTAQSYPAEYTWTATYKGFNDTLASWSANRVMNQNCGQTWLNTFSEINKHWSSAKQLEAMQLVTWNDYEEGTELESGIDNCVAIATSISGSALNWSLTAGAESTIDHYTLFISSDGQNLMSLGDVAAGTHTFNLASVQLSPATYTLYVKAVGRPNLTNKMSAAVSYRVNAVSPAVNLSVTPTTGTATLNVGASATVTTAPGATISTSNIDFGDGTTASGMTANHAYRSAGTYTVRATVVDSYGTSGTAASSVNVLNQPPVAALSVTPLSATAPANVTASTAASSDPDGNVASSTIDFGDGTVASGPNATHTYASAGAFVVIATVYDNLGASSSTTQSVTISPAVPVSLPHSAWRLMYADSQERICENGAAANAIDGNPATIWVTSYCPNAPMPHELQIDLGATYSLSGFQYLPRQDGGVNGDIRGYNFFVSLDGVNWGSPVATGELITAGGDQGLKQVTFAASNGRYVRLQATSEVNGNPWAVVAELNVLGSALYVNGPSVATTTLSASTTAVGTPVTGTVTLSGMALANGAVVALASNNTGVATVPATVTIAPGSNSANFTITTLAAGQAAITASYYGTAAAASLNTTSLAASMSTIPQKNWKLLYADSQETQCETGSAVNAFDGNPATNWVTQWCASTPGMPHELQIDLGAQYSVLGFQYLPRQDGGVNGDITDYNFFVSNDGVNWGSAISSGQLVTVAGDQSQRQVTFSAVTARYVRFQTLSEVNGNPWAVVAEFNVLGAAVSGVSINSISVPSPVANGSVTTATVTLNAPAPSGGTAVMLSSSDPGVASVPASVTVPQGALSATFNVAASSAPTGTQTRITASYAGAAVSAMLTVNAAPIPNTGWRLLWTDSQETVCENGAASNALDGNAVTNWVTQWCTSSPAMPHELQIDMGATHQISGFRYLPRQDGGFNGNIRNYNFFVSTDGVNWGTPVAAGTLVTSARDASLKEVTFAPISGRYFRLQALSEVNGNPWAVVAELTLLGQ